MYDECLASCDSFSKHTLHLLRSYIAYASIFGLFSTMFRSAICMLVYAISTLLCTFVCLFLLVFACFCLFLLVFACFCLFVSVCACFVRDL